MKKFFSVAATAALLLSSCADKANNTYQVAGTAAWDGLEEGQQVVLINMSNRDTLGVSDIKEGKFEFNGSADTASVVLAQVDRRHAVQFILEPGVINVDIANRTSAGTPLNDVLANFKSAVDSCETSEAYKEVLLNSYKQNEQNLVGQMIWGDMLYYLDYNEMVALLETAQPAV
ncbi:MAG: DUF4369 domain-containing protein, partial [Bacteroidales bacterium]|nr:DUF4369 domain-containing protein [Bacteroidales bacterium]